MSSDNGKPGRLDMFDVWSAMSYVESHYAGTMQLQMERAPGARRSELLCSLTFVPNDAAAVAGGGLLLEVAATPSELLRLPDKLHRAVYHLQELIDAARPGQLVFGIMN